MHREAEYGVVSHFGYKEKLDWKNIQSATMSWIKQFLPLLSFGEQINKNGGSITTGDVPEWLRELAKIESGKSQHEEFIKEIKANFFKTRVFVFTPKGDAVDLPSDANPIDFAYAIHSDIGDHMAGAKVNGKMVSLGTTLKNGDIVEILTKENAKPSTKWLDIAKTTMAKKHIRNLLGKA